MRAARRACDLAAEIVDVSAELGLMPAELPAAFIAARQAREAAHLAEFAAVDARVRDPYAEARRHFYATLRHEQSCALALRRFAARVENYEEVCGAVAERKQLQRERMRGLQSDADESPPYSIAIDGEISDVSLRKDPLRLDVESRPVLERPN
jgi:hypothetical protein